MTKGSETQKKLIEAATQLFYEKGIHWVSFQQVASKVGITQAALYRHFADKDDLIRACALFSAESGRGIIDRYVNEEESAEKQLKAYIKGNFVWLMEKPKESVMVAALYYFAFNSWAIQELLVAINNQSVERINVRLKQGIESDRWPIKDPTKISRLIHDALLGEMLKTAHAPGEFSVEERVERLWLLVEAFIK